VFDLELSALVHQWATEVSWTIQNKWEGSQGVDGLAECSVDVPYISSGNVVEYIRAWGDKAWILEYGSGHTLDESNPYLEDYKSTDRWNPARASDGNEFIGRTAGETVYVPDGTTYESTGRAEGMRLEHQMGNKEPYESKVPLHIVHEYIEAEIPTLRSRIAELTTELIARELSITLDVVI
jgi:hypothetical protein